MSHNAATSRPLLVSRISERMTRMSQDQALGGSLLATEHEYTDQCEDRKIILYFFCN